MLTASKTNAIEAKAKTALEDVFGTTAHVPIPVPVEKIIQKYGLQIEVGDFRDTSVSGAYQKSDKTIYIAEDEPSSRKSFTLAHELGHFFLHAKKEDDVVYRTQLLEVTEEARNEEREANWFAAALLMPEQQLRHFFSITKETGELAIVFGVSSTAVYYRLKNLRLSE